MRQRADAAKQVYITRHTPGEVLAEPSGGVYER